MDLVKEQERMRERWGTRRRHPVTKNLIPEEDFESSEIAVLIARTDLKCPVCKLERTRVNKVTGEIVQCAGCVSKSRGLAKYGMNARSFYALVSKQDGKCAICLEKKNDKLVVDHCHDLGHVRSLICQSCNIILGQCRDNEDILHNAIKYIQHNRVTGGWFAKDLGGEGAE